MTSFEGAACGVPQLVPDWSATRELWAGYGRLLPVSDVRFEPKYLNTAHAIIDARAAANELLRMYDNPEFRAEYGRRALDIAARQWSWNQVGAEFGHLINDALHEPKPSPLSLDDLMAAREGPLASELAGVVYLKDGKPVLARDF